MGIPLILGALQVAGGIGGAIQGNQNRQRQKGEIGRAYEIGKERLRVRQTDQRQSSAEGLVARGLAQGGNARVGRGTPALEGKTRGISWVNRTPVRTTGPGVRDLGAQTMVDLTREQQLEQQALRSQRDAALAGADAGATQALVGGIGQAIAGGIQGYQTGVMANAAFGLNPVNPLQPAPQSTVDAFNIYPGRA